MPFSPLVFTKILGTASIGAFTVGAVAGSELLSHLKWQQPPGFSTSSIGFQRTLHHVRVGLAGLVAVPIVAFTGAMIADWQPYLVYSIGLVGYAGFRFARIILPIIERETHSGGHEGDKDVVIKEEKKASSSKEDISASSPGMNESLYNIDKRDYEDAENEVEAKEVATDERGVPVTENVVEDYDKKSDELEVREFYKQRLIATLLSGASFLIALVGVAGEAK
jgi:hypothetical protein